MLGWWRGGGVRWIKILVENIRIKKGNEINIPPPNEKTSGDSRERKCSVKDEQKWGK